MKGKIVSKLTKLTRTKKIIISAILIQLVCIVTILSVTLAKYYQRVNGYTEYQVEKFNAAILSGSDQMKVSFSTQDFFPGMKLSADGQTPDTSAHREFRVANGTSLENASKLKLQYTVRIRTSQVLPLEYTLRAGDSYYKTMPEPELITSVNAADRYEYKFDPTPIGQEEGTEASNGEPEIIENESSGGNANYPNNGEGKITQADSTTEATFILDPATSQANPFVYHTHELIAEWPIDGEKAANAGIEYMKEVEIVEIIVTVTTIDNTVDEQGTVSPPDINEDDYYSSGVIFILPPENSDTEMSYSHAVDLRAFKKDAGNGGSYSFDVDNAIGLVASHSAKNIQYGMTLKIPADLLYAVSDAESGSASYSETLNYTFQMFRDDDTEQTQLLTNGRFVIYNEKTEAYILNQQTAEGAADTDTDETESGESIIEIMEFTAMSEAVEFMNSHNDKDELRIYFLYDVDITGKNVLNNTRYNASSGKYEYYRDYHGYTITIDTLDGITVETENGLEKENELIFLNKLEIIVDAEFIGAAADNTVTEAQTDAAPTE